MINITWTTAPLPFRRAFAHASATRRYAQNLIVRVEDAEGRVGLGEGCPRDYVTGETIASAVAAVARWRAALSRLGDLDALRRWLRAAEAEVAAAPSAACAVELALLDLFARQAEKPVEDLLGLPRLDRALPVTAVYGSGPAAVFLLQNLRFRRAGMADAKLKLTGDAARDGWRARRLTASGRTRVDANNLWPDARAAIMGLARVQKSVWAVEEPVAPRDWTGLAEVAAATGLAVILDESLSGPSDLDALADGPRYVLNVRLSRLGGLLRTLDTIAAARACGMDVILGAHVGETSILARAGLVAAGAAGPTLAAYEGAYGTHLLKHDAVAPSLTFGSDGQVVPGREWRPGLPGWGLAWIEATTWTAP